MMAATSALARQLQALTDEGIPTDEQAAQLWQAAQEADEPDTAPASSLGVLDILGYLGEALLLGALIFLGFTLWGDLGRGGKTTLAIASFVAPAAGGAVLEWSYTRRGLARVLLALACFAAGFACSVIIDDQDLVISTGVVVTAAVVGLITLRSTAFYLSAWVGAIGFVPAFVVVPTWWCQMVVADTGRLVRLSSRRSTSATAGSWGPGSRIWCGSPLPPMVT